MVDFSKVEGGPLEDDSWGEDEEFHDEENDQNYEAEYYDEEDEAEAVNAALEDLRNR